MLLKIMAIFFDIGIGLFAWMYIRFLWRHTGNYKLAIGFGLISVTSALCLTLVAFMLPGADIIVALIFLSYCTITATFILQLKAKGISPVFVPPTWATPILTVLLLGMLLAGILAITLIIGLTQLG